MLPLVARRIRAPFLTGVLEPRRCMSISAMTVLSRMCSHIDADEALYMAARRRFVDGLAGVPSLNQRVVMLRRAGAELEARASDQAKSEISDCWLSPKQMQSHYQ